MGWVTNDNYQVYKKTKELKSKKGMFHMKQLVIVKVKEDKKGWRIRK